MSKSNITRNLISFVLFLILSACSTTPAKPIIISDLEALKLDKFFTIDNSLEVILDHINRDGEVIIEAVSKKRRGIKKRPFYIKIMATPEGLNTEIFPIE